MGLRSGARVGGSGCRCPSPRRPPPVDLGPAPWLIRAVIRSLLSRLRAAHAKSSGRDPGPGQPTPLQRRVGTPCRTREARHAAFDICIVEPSDGFDLSTRDPSVEVGAAHGTVPHPPECDELAVPDRLANDADRSGRKPCGLLERNQGAVLMLRVRLEGRFTRQARKGLGEIGECSKGWTVHRRSARLRSRRRHARSAIAAAKGEGDDLARPKDGDGCKGGAEELAACQVAPCRSSRGRRVKRRYVAAEASRRRRRSWRRTGR
jgi:hypothetical protein